MFNSRQIKQLELVKSTKEKGLYTFQRVLESKSGKIVTIDGIAYKMISSYDYLGLIGNEQIEKAAVDAILKYGSGSGGVRLLTGTNELHIKLEQKLASFIGTEASVTYTSGYIANLAILSALFNSKDIALVDSKIHQSTIDACKLAGLPFRRFRHNDLTSLENLIHRYKKKQRILIISEGVFSMDGDICDLPGLIKIKNKYGALLMIDKAHSLGVLGENGRGVSSHFNLASTQVDIYTGSLSKAVPANGGFVAGSKDLITLLQHGSTPFIFSAAMAPPSVASAIEALNVMSSGTDIFTRLWENTTYFNKKLQDLGYDTGNSASPVIPVMIGELDATLQFAKKLSQYNIIATPVVYPAVPHNSGRLRLCITSGQSRDYLNEVLDVFAKLR